MFWEGLKGLNISALFRSTFPLVHRLFQGTDEIFPCHVTWHFLMLIGSQACKCGRPSGWRPVAAQSLSIPKPFGQEEKQWCLEPLRGFYLCEPARLCDWLQPEQCWPSSLCCSERRWTSSPLLWLQVGVNVHTGLRRLRLLWAQDEGCTRVSVGSVNNSKRSESKQEITLVPWHER